MTRRADMPRAFSRCHYLSVDAGAESEMPLQYFQFILCPKATDNFRQNFSRYTFSIICISHFFYSLQFHTKTPIMLVLKVAGNTTRNRLVSWKQISCGKSRRIKPRHAWPQFSTQSNMSRQPPPNPKIYAGRGCGCFVNMSEKNWHRNDTTRRHATSIFALPLSFGWRRANLKCHFSIFSSSFAPRPRTKHKTFRVIPFRLYV